MRLLILLLLAGCAAPEPDWLECERRADRAGVYGMDVVRNILLRDNLIRECIGMEPRPLPPAE